MDNKTVKNNSTELTSCEAIILAQVFGLLFLVLVSKIYFSFVENYSSLAYFVFLPIGALSLICAKWISSSYIEKKLAGIFVSSLLFVSVFIGYIAYACSSCEWFYSNNKLVAVGAMMFFNHAAIINYVVKRAPFGVSILLYLLTLYVNIECIFYFLNPSICQNPFNWFHVLWIMYVHLSSWPMEEPSLARIEAEVSGENAMRRK